MVEGRTQKSIRNSSYALICQGTTVLLSFITRTIFIHTLGVEYLGVNGLFTNILTTLSFAELGFGTSIIYVLYKPLVEKDKETVKSIMRLSKKVYTLIGCVIFCVGILLLPNLEFFISDISESPFSLLKLQIVYLILLLDCACSYFLTYKRALLNANQQSYLDQINCIEFQIVKFILQCFTLILLKNYFLYIIIQVVCTLLSNISISQKANREFIYLKEKDVKPLDVVIVQKIKKNIFGMFFNKFSSVVVSGVDNILISKYVGLIATGIYSNYMLIINAIKNILLQIIDAVTPSLGNYIAENREEENFKIYKNITFIIYSLTLFCTSCFYNLINPFIKIIWGDEYIFKSHIVIVISMNFFFYEMRQANMMFINANGLYWEIRIKSIFEAVINLLASYALLTIYNMGIFGILLGTAISNFATNFWWEPYIVYKKCLRQKPIKYYALIIKYVVHALISITIINFITCKIPDGYVMFFVRSCIVAFMTLGSILAFYYKTEEMKFILEKLLLPLLEKIRKR